MIPSGLCPRTQDVILITLLAKWVQFKERSCTVILWMTPVLIRTSFLKPFCGDGLPLDMSADRRTQTPPFHPHLWFLQNQSVSGPNGNQKCHIISLKSMCWGVCLPVCMCACVCVHEHAHTCSHVHMTAHVCWCRGHRLMSGVCLHHSPPYFWDSYWAWGSLLQSDWLISKLKESSGL